MKSKQRSLLILVLLGVSFFGVGMVAVTPSNASLNAIALTCPNSVRIGQLLSCKVTGLTVGTAYVGTAMHSDGNITYNYVAATSTEYIRFTMTTADSDNAVTVATATSSTATADDTQVVNLFSPSSDVPYQFFQELLAPVLLIGVFGLLMTAFFVFRRRK